MTKGLWTQGVLFSLLATLNLIGFAQCGEPPPTRSCLTFYLEDDYGNWSEAYLDERDRGDTERLVQTYHKACNYRQNSEENPNKHDGEGDSGCQSWSAPFPHFPVYKRAGEGCSGSGDTFSCDYSRYKIAPPARTNYDIPITYRVEVDAGLCGGVKYLRRVELWVRSVHLNWSGGLITDTNGWFIEATKIINRANVVGDWGTLWFNPQYRGSRWHNIDYTNRFFALSDYLDSDTTCYPDATNQDCYMFGDQSIPGGEEPYNAVAQPIESRLVGYFNDAPTTPVGNQTYLKVMSPIHWWDGSDGPYYDIDTGGRRDTGYDSTDVGYGHFGAPRQLSPDDPLHDHEGIDIAIEDDDKDGLYEELGKGCYNNYGCYIPAVALVSGTITKVDYEPQPGLGCYIHYEHEGGVFNDYLSFPLGNPKDYWSNQMLRSLYGHLAIFPSGGTTVNQNNGGSKQACINGLKVLLNREPINLTRTPGQIVGVVGRTGGICSTCKTHLHFAIIPRSATNGYSWDAETFIEPFLNYPFCGRSISLGFPCAKCPRTGLTYPFTCSLNTSYLRCNE